MVSIVEQPSPGIFKKVSSTLLSLKKRAFEKRKFCKSYLIWACRFENRVSGGAGTRDGAKLAVG
jgi:hypothetical protein